MANRPCRADADLKRLWQLLLPDARLPACRAQENTGADAGKTAAPPTPDDAEARQEFPLRRRDNA